MKRLLLLSLFALWPLSSHAAVTSVQWGATKTSNPWVTCLYDSNNVCQTIFTMNATSGAVLFSPAVGGTGVNNGSNTLTLNSSAIVGTSAGTLASSATSPLAIDGTTGVITCGGCAPTSFSGTPPIDVTAGVISITGAAGKVLAGASPAFTATPTLGIAGSTTGTITFDNTTSGTLVLSPPTSGVLSGTLTLPNTTDTLVGKATTDTLTNKTLTSPTINTGSLASPTVTTAFTATGLVTNGDLVSPSMTVNGTTCTLGSTCSPTSASTSITVGTTTIASGTSGKVEYNNGGVIGEYSVTGTGNAVLSAAPTFSGTVVMGSPLLGVSGGTGVSNSGKTITLGANLTTTGGATTLGFGATGRTYTFPDAADTVDLITQTQTLTNKTIATGSNNITGIVGTSIPTAGNIGEAVVGTEASTGVSISNNTAKTVKTISLTAGNYIIFGTVDFLFAGTPTSILAAIGIADNTVPAKPTALQAFTAGTSSAEDLSTGMTYVQITGNTTFYLIAQASFTSTATAFGVITAIRQP